MDDSGGERATGFRHVIKLKELLQKWQSAIVISENNISNNINNDNKSNHASDPLHGPIGLPLMSTKRLRADSCDFDEDSLQTLHPPPDVPRGYLAVYVGHENRRFIIPTRYLSHNLFQLLLQKVEEEYGYDHEGALTIPCEVETFKYLLNCIEAHPMSGKNHESCEF